MISGCKVMIVPLSYMPVIGWEQARKHKKHRINKKWLKRYGRKPVHDESKAYLCEGIYGEQVMLVTQKLYDKLLSCTEEE